MASFSRFLNLPRELRDMIYRQYVHIEGGYKFNSLSWKLRGAPNSKDPFALQRTCKYIHQETEGLALRHNTITFSTLTSWPDGIKAARWQRMMCTGPLTVFDFQISMVWVLRNKIGDFVREHVAHLFPSFLPHLDWLRRPHPRNVTTNNDDRNKIYNHLGERPSLFRNYLWYILDLINGDRNRDRPWFINPDSNLDKLAFDMDRNYSLIFGEGSPRTREYFEIPSNDQWWNYRFSAAAYAIEFLDLYPSSRIHMRNIVLNEDHISVAYPECHGRGLVRFCDENPRLRIERRVDLFLTVLSRPAGVRPNYPYDPPPDATSNISLWIKEAIALPPAISLVFIGSQVPAASNALFTGTVIPDARSRHALEVACARGIFEAPPPMEEYPVLTPFVRGANGGHFYKGVAKAILDMVENNDSETSQIRCDFDPGPSWDVEDVIRERDWWSSKKWLESGNWKAFIDLRGCRHVLDRRR